MFLNVQGKIEQKKINAKKVFGFHATTLGNCNGLVKRNQEPKSSKKLGLPSSMGLFNLNYTSCFCNS